MPWGFWGNGFFGTNRQTSVETAQQMRQKAIQGLRVDSDGLREVDFLAVLNRALSALF